LGTIDRGGARLPRLASTTRLELGLGEAVTSARHTAVVLEPMLRKVAHLLDGERTLSACVEAVTSEIAADTLTLGELPTDTEARQNMLRWMVLDAMSRLRKLGLLEPPLPEPVGEASQGDDDAGT